MENLKLYLQLFAENESETEETPTEEVEQAETEAEETENVDFEDTEADEEQDSEKPEEKVEKPAKNKKMENMLNAQRRLEEKQKQREQEIARNAKVEAVKKVSGGKNRFTGEPIKDEYDVAEYEIMLELESQGKDVLEEYPKVIKEKQRQERLEAQKALEEKEANAKKVQDDLNSFTTKYGEDIAKEILQDESFAEFADELIGYVPLTTIYERYKREQERIEKQVEERLLKKEARRRSSPGVPGNSHSKQKSFADMTDEEFKEFSKSVASRY